MIAQGKKNDSISNNLANVNSFGFKKDVAFVDFLEDSSDSDLKIETDYSQGNLVQTNNPLDLAIKGEGFFTVETENGEAYTRNGHFTVDTDGFIKTFGGDYLVGNQGWINLSKDGFGVGEVNISRNGKIYINGEYIDSLRIVEFENSIGVQKAGGNLFINDDRFNMPDEVIDPQVIQGNLEISNVNPVVEMIEMIELQRGFESSQRVIKSIDNMLGRTVNDIGKFQ